MTPKITVRLFSMSGHVQRIETVAALRARLTAVCPPIGSERTGTVQRLGTGITALDRLLEGGFSRGKLTAWAGELGSGLTSLLRPGVHQTLEAGERVGLIDGEGTLYAPDWVATTGELWVIRATTRSQAMWAAELMASCGAFALTAVAPGGARDAFGDRWAARLRRAAKEGDTALVVLDPSSPSSLAATWGLRIVPVGLEIATGRWTVRVQRTRGGPPAWEEVSFDVQDRLFPCRMPTSPVVPDRRPPPSGPRRTGPSGEETAADRSGSGTGEPRAAL